MGSSEAGEPSTPLSGSTIFGGRAQSAPRGSAAIAALLGLAATALAAIGSWNASLWTDESATISAAQRSLSDLWRLLGNLDLVHGLYYLFMHFWTRLFGTSAFALRLPSAIVVGVAAVCIYWLGVRLRGPRFGTYAVVAFAVLPRVFWSGAEGRSYGLTAMFAAAATLALFIALERAGSWNWITYAVLILAAIACNLFVSLLVVAHVVGLFLDRSVSRKERISMLVAAAAAGIIASPFLLAAASQSGQLGQRSFGIRDLVANVAVNQWFLGDTPTTTTGITTTSLEAANVGTWWVPASLLFAAVSWLVILYAVFRNIVGLRTKNQQDPCARPILAWLLPWALVPPAVIGVYSLLASPMYSPRYLTFTTPAAAMLIALGLLSVPKNSVRNALITVLALTAIPIYVSQRQIYGKNSSDWVSVAHYVQQNAASGDGVYFAPRYESQDGTVGQTTRGIATAYPVGFRGLVDISLLTTAAAAGNLTGTSRRLRDSAAELADVHGLWVIQRVDYPKASTEDDAAFLAGQRFRAIATWTGPLDRVVHYIRTS